MSAETWEENSQLVLKKLEELAAQDEKILEQVVVCRLSAQRLKTIISLLGGIVVVVMPIGFYILQDISSIRYTEFKTLEKLVLDTRERILQDHTTIVDQKDAVKNLEDDVEKLQRDTMQLQFHMHDERKGGHNGR